MNTPAPHQPESDDTDRLAARTGDTETNPAQPPPTLGAGKVFRYLVNTGLSFVVNLGLTAILHELFAVDESVAYGVALIVVFIMNFIMFRYYVFDGRGEHPGKQLGLFLGTSITFRVGEWFAFRLAHEVLGVYYLLAIVLVQGTTFVIKYFVYGGWLFKTKPNPSAPA